MKLRSCVFSHNINCRVNYVCKLDIPREILTPSYVYIFSINGSILHGVIARKAIVNCSNILTYFTTNSYYYV